MKPSRNPVASIVGTLCAAALLAFLAASCAAPLKIEASVDPLALLDPGALAYARLSGSAARDLAPSLLPAAQAASMKSLLERTKVVALSLGDAHPSDEGTPAPNAKALGAVPFQAALLGDYPFRAAALSLGSDPAWKRVKPAYYNAKLGVYVALPGPQLVLASTGPLDSLLASAKAPGPSPIPARLSDLGSREIVLWAPEPFSGLAAEMLGEAMDVPVRGLLVAASPVQGEAGRYKATVVFMMEDAEALRTFRPLLKLAWYGMAKMLFGDEAEAAIALPLRADGELYAVSEIPLSREALARVLGLLRAGRRD
jgi:hypothetical protein